MATIEGFDNYLIYPDGKVYNQKYDRILSQKSDKDGYLIVGLSINGKRYYKGVHRLLGRAFIPNPENKPVIDHIDRNKTNNDLSNLRWATLSENAQNKDILINNTSGYTNIHIVKNGVMYEKQINNKRIRKFFKTLEKAIEYKKKIKNLI
tara:strand:+ start:28 stop:477 length:450 start_codon:yes stop_codon:yes gene_type:complete